MKVQIYEFPWDYVKGSDKPLEIREAGYAEMKEFDREKLWDLCNWAYSSQRKPDNFHSDIEVANSNVIFVNPTDGKFHLCESLGWSIFESLDEVKERLMKHGIFWNKRDVISC